MLKKFFKCKFGIILIFILTIMAGFAVCADDYTEVTNLTEFKTAISEGKDIKLMANITLDDNTFISKNCTLDLNGNTLNVGAKTIVVYSNMTLKDGSLGGSGKIVGSGAANSYIIQIGSGTNAGNLIFESGSVETTTSRRIRVLAVGNLTINGGNIKSKTYAISNSGISTINGGTIRSSGQISVIVSAGTVTMNGGTIETTSVVGVYTAAGSEFVMNGGTITAPQQAITNLGNSTINGGTVKATTQVGIYVSSGTLTVNGGTVQAPNDAINIKDNAGATVAIASGTVTAANYTGIYVGNGDTLTITGGTVSAGYAAIDDRGNVIISGGHIVSDNNEDKQTINVQGDETVTKATLVMNDGKVEALGNGSAINLHSNAIATINGGTINALEGSGNDGGAGITAFKDTEVTINDGTISSYSFALVGNGSDSGGNEGTNAKFTITGGTLNSSAAAGIYAPQVNGETVISGGTITGDRTGIEIRAGSLTITGGTFAGNKYEYDYIDNRNGLTTKGAAVSVCQHTTKQPIMVNISGGTFDAIVPFSEVNALENSQEDVAKINYDISGGIFHSSGDKTVTVEDCANGPFISGGKYTHYVTPYVKDGYGEKIENDPIRPEPNMKAVYKWREVSWKPESENGTTAVVRHKTTFDDGTTIETEPDGR